MKIRETQYTAPNVCVLLERKFRVLISTSKYEEKIAAQLIELGLSAGQDFLCYSQLREKIVQRYYNFRRA